MKMLCSKFNQIGGCKIQLVSIESRKDNRNEKVHLTQGKSAYLSYLDGILCRFIHASVFQPI